MIDSRVKDLCVLIIDDDEFMLEVIKTTLNKLDIHNTIVANSGDAGIEILATRRNEVDVILCDLQMPKIDGVQVVRHLASIEYTGGLLLVSGEDLKILKTAESVAKAHNLNILGAFPKPIKAMPLLRKLQKYVLQKKEMHNDNSSYKYTKEELEVGFAKEEFILYFQPKVSLVNKAIVGMESLVRWQHSERGLVPPDAFISLLEETGLIDELTQVVYRKAIAASKTWEQQGLPFKVSVNISMDNLTSVDFPDDLCSVAEEIGVRPQDITLEITESRLMENVVVSLDILTRLRLKGFMLSIDDFGTGYSSLEKIREIPFDELKIDKSFVSGASEDASIRAILESSIDLSNKLDMKIVAEGVETAADVDLLQELGCDVVQGYYFAKPMPEQEFGAWMKKWHMD